MLFSIFNGVVRPYDAMTPPWKYTIYWINPSTYWIGGVLAATLRGQPVRCSQDEVARFDTPNGQTCQAYAGEYATSAGGYLLNPDATSGCEYCYLSSGDQYLAGLNIKPDQMWRDFGIFLAWVFFGYFLVYYFIFTVRIKGWTFGFGPLFRTLGKGVDKIKSLFKKKNKDDEEQE